MIMEGIFNGGRPSSGRSNSPSPERLIIYAGGLSEAYGVDRLVNAIEGLSDPSIRLQTYGRGELVSWIDNLAVSSCHVGVNEFVPRAEVVRSYAGADLLVQPRPVGQRIARYSFPSKLLEYMGSGTPVLSTRLSGIPSEYEPFLYWIDDDSEDGIRDAILKVLAVPREERLGKAHLAAEFVYAQRSSEAQGARLRDFLNSIIVG